MLRVYIIALAIGAIFTMSVTAVSTAYAVLPEFEGVFPTGFTAKLKGASILETRAGRVIECGSGSTDEGEVTGEKAIKIKEIILTECKAKEVDGGECQSGNTAGQINAPLIEGELVYASKANKEVALDLRPEGGGNFTRFTCKLLGGNAKETLTVDGSLICRITPVGEETKIYVLACKQKKGTQELTEYESGTGAKFKDFLETKGEGAIVFKFEQSGVEATFNITAEKQLTIKA